MKIMMRLKKYAKKHNMQISKGSYDIGFVNSYSKHLDQTEFDLKAGEGVDELAKLFENYCKELGLKKDSVVCIIPTPW